MDWSPIIGKAVEIGGTLIQKLVRIGMAAASNDAEAVKRLNDELTQDMARASEALATLGGEQAKRNKLIDDDIERKFDHGSEP